MIRREYKTFGFCCGLGGGAKGFRKAASQVGNMVATWKCVGGIDVDPAAARDFETLIGVPCTVMDLMTREQYTAFHGAEPPANWREAIRWNARHEQFFAKHGRRQRVFCASLADVFDNAVSVQWRYDLLRLIMDTPNLDWLLLTKRIGNAAGMLEQAMRALTGQREGWADNYLDNVWIGATVVNQEEADRDIPKLLATKAAVQFLSMEPLLGPVDLSHHLWKCCGNRVPGHPGDGWMQPPDPPECCGDVEPAGVQWVIVGGESGNGARPMHPDWARGLRDQCAAAGVPFLFKQWGEHAPNDRTMAEVEASQRGYTFVHYSAEQPYPVAAMDRVGKKAAGRLLDGVQHDGFPEVQS